MTIASSFISRVATLVSIVVSVLLISYFGFAIFFLLRFHLKLVSLFELRTCASSITQPALDGRKRRQSTLLPRLTPRASRCHLERRPQRTRPASSFQVNKVGETAAISRFPNLPLKDQYQS